jgi:asparagine synthetase B (glutamine-hydrolysing)
MEELNQEESKVLDAIELKMMEVYNLNTHQLSEEHQLITKDIDKLVAENSVEILLKLRDKDYIKLKFSTRHPGKIDRKNNKEVYIETTVLMPKQINLTKKTLNQIHGKVLK